MELEGRVIVLESKVGSLEGDSKSIRDQQANLDREVASLKLSLKDELYVLKELLLKIDSRIDLCQVRNPGCPDASTMNRLKTVGTYTAGSAAGATVIYGIIELVKQLLAGTV